jgi:hypothetical protein
LEIPSPSPSEAESELAQSTSTEEGKIIHSWKKPFCWQYPRNGGDTQT